MADMMDSIIAAQKSKNPGADIDKKALEDALSGYDTISSADLKKILAGGAPSATASNVIDIAQDIKILAENSEVEKQQAAITAENTDNMLAIQAATVLTDEEKNEQGDLLREEIDVLKDIEANTRGEDIVPVSSFSDDSPKSSGMMSGLLGFLGGGLLGGMGGLLGGGATGTIGKTLISGINGFIGTIFKSLLKGALITMIVGGIASGIMDGLEEYKKTGKIKDALWAGLGGFVEFVSFGLFDKEDMDKMKQSAESIFAESGIVGLLVEGVKGITNFLVDTIMGTDTFKALKEAYDEKGLVKMLWDGYVDWMGFLVDTLFGEGTMDKAIARITEDWNRFIQTIEDFIEAVTPNFAKKVGTKLSSVEAKDPKTGETIISGSLTKGQYEDTAEITHKGKKYKISKDTFEKVQQHIDKGKIGLAENLLRQRGSEETKELSKPIIGDFKIDESHQMNIDPNTGLEIIPPNKADTVIKQSEENAWTIQNSMADGGSLLVNAPTTNNVASHTTAIAPVKARNSEPSALKYNSAPAY